MVEEPNKTISDKEYFSLTPCHVNLRKPSEKNPDYHRLLAVIPFVVNASITKNMIKIKSGDIPIIVGYKEGQTGSYLHY